MLRSRYLHSLLASALLAALAVWQLAAQDTPEIAAPPAADIVERDRPAPISTAADVLDTPEHAAVDRVNAETPEETAADSGTLVVRVVDAAGDPVPNATVDASFRRQLRSFSTRIESLTNDAMRRRVEEPDDEGRFVIEGCIRGSWKVTADAPGFAPTEDFVSIDRERAGVRLELTRESRIVGRVVDANGIAIEGATVQESSVPDRRKLYPRDFRNAYAFSDQSGSFHLSFAGGGVFALTAKAAGFAPNLPHVVTCDGPEQVDDITLVLQRTGSIIGLVLDEGGTAHVAARVILNKIASRTDPSAYSPTQRVRTDDAGHFRFDDLKAGNYLITICEAAEPSAPSKQSLYPQEKPRQLTSITLPPGEQLHITIQDPGPGVIQLHGSVKRGDQAVTTGSVTFIPSRIDGLESARFAEVEADGTYELTLHESGPGTLIHSRFHSPYSDWLGVGSYSSASTFSIDVPNQPLFRYDIELPSGSISGTIIGERDPMSTMTHAVPTGGDALWNPGASQSTMTFTWDDFGSESEWKGDRQIERPFEVSGLSPGTWDVYFTCRPTPSNPAGAYAALQGVVLGPGESVEGLRIQLRAACSIEIETGGNTLRAEDVHYTLRDEAGNTLQSSSLGYADDRRYRIDSVPPGRLSLEVRTRSACSETVEISTRAGEESFVRLQLERAARLSVITLASDGQPATAIVRVFDAANRERAHSSALDAPLALDGRSIERHELGALAPGGYRVVALAPDGRRVEQALEWKSGSDRTIELRFGASQERDE